MASNCSNNKDMPYTYELYADPTTVQIIFYTIAPVLTLFSVILFFESVMYVRAKIPVKIRRNRLIWILGIFPIFSTTSLLALYLPRSTLITMCASSVYFSVAIYQFLMLIIDYYGGRNAMILVMKDVDVKVRVPPVLCCCLCLPTIQITKSTQPWLRRGVLQVAFIQPATLFVSAVLWTDGRYIPGEMTISKPYFWLSLISLVSTMGAMQALAIVYQSSKMKLKDYRITSKYLAIQLSMIFSNIQLAVLAFLSAIGVIPCTGIFSSLGLTYHIYNFLVVCEFFALGIFARAFFRSRKMGNLDQVIGSELENTTDPESVIINNNTGFTESTRENASSLKYFYDPKTVTKVTHPEGSDTRNQEERSPRQRSQAKTDRNPEDSDSTWQKNGHENKSYITDVIEQDPDVKVSLSTVV